jgi:hypothetical protein
MLEKKDHTNYLREKGSFPIDCRQDIFTQDEREILYKYGYWFKALTDGDLEPYTQMQRRFILVAQGKEEAHYPEEIAWVKYLFRMNYEKKYGDRYSHEPKLDGDTFYSREMAKQQKSMMFKVTSENHRK